jgi:hypothetical protein
MRSRNTLLLCVCVLALRVESWRAPSGRHTARTVSPLTMGMSTGAGVGVDVGVGGVGGVGVDVGVGSVGGQERSGRVFWPYNPHYGGFVRELSASPRVLQLEGFLSAESCRVLVSFMDDTRRREEREEREERGEREASEGSEERGAIEGWEVQEGWEGEEDVRVVSSAAPLLQLDNSRVQKFLPPLVLLGAALVTYAHYTDLDPSDPVSIASAALLLTFGLSTAKLGTLAFLLHHTVSNYLSHLGRQQSLKASKHRTSSMIQLSKDSRVPLKVRAAVGELLGKCSYVSQKSTYLY